MLESISEENRSGEALGEDLTRRSTKDGKQEGQEDEKYGQEAQDSPNMTLKKFGRGSAAGKVRPAGR